MKEYLLLFRGGDSERQQLSPEEGQNHMKQWQDWIVSLAQKEQFIGGQPLVAGGKVLSGTAKKVTDGPFMEGKEVVGGYLHIRAEDMEAAIKISEACPNLLAESGTVEIREIGTMNV